MDAPLDSPGALRCRLESSRLVGLLLVVTMAAAARWLEPTEVEAVADEPAPALQPTSLAREPLAPADEARVRPASAALCLALQDKLRALQLRASGSLTEVEQLDVRRERRRSREHLAALRCAGGDRSWF